MFVLLAQIAAAQSVTTAGSCPGVIDIDIQNFTPNGQFALLTGNAGGNSAIPAGPCAGTQTQLGNLTLRVLGNLNAGGDANLTPNVPAGACNQAVQVLNVSNCQLSPPTTLGSQCQLPNVAVPSVAPVGVMTDPSFFGVHSSGIVDNGLRGDVTFTNAQLGAIPASAGLVFEFFDASFVSLCTITYDLSDAVVDAGFTTDSGGVAIDPVSLALTGGDSTCGKVDAAVFGTRDLRDFLATTDWSIAYGPLAGQFGTDLENAVVASGQNFAQDWDPFVFTTYVGNTGSPAFDLGYTFQFDRTCDEVRLDNAGLLIDLLGAPTTPLDSFASSTSFYVFAL
ncbi:MAG: hypothetical protein ABMB14_08600 [Myxococcota bacterium]